MGIEHYEINGVPAGAELLCPDCAGAMREESYSKHLHKCTECDRVIKFNPECVDDPELGYLFGGYDRPTSWAIDEAKRELNKFIPTDKFCIVEGADGRYRLYPL